MSLGRLSQGIIFGGCSRRNILLTKCGNSQYNIRNYSLAGASMGAAAAATAAASAVGTVGSVGGAATLTNYAELMASLKDSFIKPPEMSIWHISKIQDVLTWLHDTAGLNWWLSIAAITFAFRTLVLPLNISLVRNSARLNLIRPEVERLQAEMDKATDETVRKNYASQIVKLFEEAKCNPFKNIASPFIMTPMFLSVFMAVERTIVFTPSAAEGGAAWFENLMVPDSTYLLPVISAMTWIGTLKAGADRIRTPRAHYFENFLSYLSLAMIPVTSTLPQGIFIYWISSNTYSLLQLFILRLPKLRKLLRIPPPPPINN